MRNGRANNCRAAATSGPGGARNRRTRPLAPSMLTPDGMDANCARILWERADKDAHRPAIVEREAVTDFAALRARAAGVAAAVSRVIEPGDRVGILLERGAQAAAAFFGVAASGGVAILLHDSLRPRQIEYALSHGGARMLITARALLARHPRPLDTAAMLLDIADIPG